MKNQTSMKRQTGAVCKRFFSLLCFCPLITLLAACTSAPEGITPVDDFDLPRYLGRWYEIARLDHRFERGLNQVTADYSLREDGGVKVVNRGVDRDGQVEEAQGRAYFVDDSRTGHLKVSFFGPFYGAYVIFELAEDYDYAFVSGPNRNYLWLLSRKPHVEPRVLEAFKQQASALGFDLSELILVEQASDTVK